MQFSVRSSMYMYPFSFVDLVGVLGTEWGGGEGEGILTWY